MPTHHERRDVFDTINYLISIYVKCYLWAFAAVLWLLALFVAVMLWLR